MPNCTWDATQNPTIFFLEHFSGWESGGIDSRHTAKIAISLEDPASKQPLPDFSGLRMRDYAKHLGASLLAPPLPFEINLGPPRVVGE